MSADRKVNVQQPGQPNSFRLPGMHDLMSRIRFAPEMGHIWLDDKRMFLLHTQSFGALRRELIENLGVEQARGLLTRMGYLSGSRDAELAKKIRPGQSHFEAFSVGPQLHALEGIVLVEPVELEIDVERGHYYGEFIWRDSAEDEAHIVDYGVGSEPVCWMQIGYACGYTSAFMGRSILYRELECRAMGHPYCRIVGKPAEEWNDAENDLRYFKAQPFANRTLVNLGAESASRTSAYDEDAASAGSRFGQRKLIGVSAGFNVVCHMINRVAATNAPVLFLGESGVGKELFGRTLHEASMRAKKPFIAINCAAIPDQLIEAELFGVEKGAYTGADSARLGRFERAHGGTLFLDEIGSLSLTAQGKLLRALQEGEIERLGDSKARRVDVRIVAATNEDLRAAAEHGAFRVDLFYRLNVFPIPIPPLRERREDIAMLMEYFVRRFCCMHHRQITGFTERAMDALLTHTWPGNVRELENVIERAVILAPENGPIDLAHMPEIASGARRAIRHVSFDGQMDASEEAGDAHASPGDAAPRDAPDSADAAETPSLGAAESALIRNALERRRGNLSAASRDLGVTRAQLAYRARKLGLSEQLRRRS